MNSLYFKIYFLLSSLIVSLAAGLNFLVDPLWYGKGNQVTDKNFYFNERISKTNLFLQKGPENYNCLIIGSSRVTSLKASFFENHNCFNFAFDGGKIEDYVEYAKFAQQKGISPEIVYVGVDALSLWETRLPVNKPEGQQSAIKAYLSWDVLVFSLRTVLNLSPSPRYYNSDFEGEILENLPPYQPSLLDTYRYIPKLDEQRVQQFKELRDIFPSAEYIGYVPPISAWEVVNEIYGPEFMEPYFQAIYQITGYFDAMYDFSAPSEVTANPKNSYDSGHYYLDIQKQIANTLQQQESTFEIMINQEKFDEYENEYISRIKIFLKSQGQIPDE